MKKTNLTHVVLALVLACTSTGYSQVNSTVTLSYFDISLSSEIYETVAPNSTLQNMLEQSSSTVSKALNSMPTTGDQRADELRELVYNEIEKATYQAFAEELQITIAPKNTLEGKINYFGSYPHTQKFKKVLKTASGEEYYMSYSVDMFKGGASVGAMGIKVGGNIKPTTVIRMAIADNGGKVVQEFEIKEKTNISIGATKTSVQGIEKGSGESPKQVGPKIIEVYKNALSILIEEFKKKNKKAYK